MLLGLCKLHHVMAEMGMATGGNSESSCFSIMNMGSTRFSKLECTGHVPLLTGSQTAGSGLSFGLQFSTGTALPRHPPWTPAQGTCPSAGPRAGSEDQAGFQPQDIPPFLAAEPPAQSGKGCRALPPASALRYSRKGGTNHHGIASLPMLSHRTLHEAGC